MAIGDLEDMAARIRAVLPQGWFPSTEENSTPVLDGLLTGFAWPWAQLHALLAYTANQARLQSSTGNFIDAAAADYFGSDLARVTSETDTAYITRIQQTLIAPRNTRPALVSKLQAIAPNVAIFEPWRAPDSGCYGRDGYNTTKHRYGSRTSPATVFVEAPAGTDSDALKATIVDTKAEGVDVFYRVMETTD
ncbi:hypothetical protein J2D73_13335 [Acetobacter sacchari]|uniref:Phage tail protein n=1 Tax=Acetobacter sacchari TaxID=2661687 RepID=A0ABS3LXY0_9PROT|nr:hypothetical protein [Acetobacter sacchari]MBO1360770.1 hypothetical protein [Acetobacter sacchari]